MSCLKCIDVVSEAGFCLGRGQEISGKAVFCDVIDKLCEFPGQTRLVTDLDEENLVVFVIQDLVLTGGPASESI